MRHNRNLVAAAVSVMVIAGGIAGPATAGDKFAFPSMNGATITAAPQFAPPAAEAKQALSPSLGSFGVKGMKTDQIPLPFVTLNYGRFAAFAPGADAYAYRFLTHALASQSIANYAADYARIFAPGYAVTAWTDRVSGVIDTGYGGAVDSWTAGAYYMGRVRGPARRRDSPPDLSTMPEFRPHPELQTHPTFGK
jgi:hypothetical protein